MEVQIVHKLKVQTPDPVLVNQYLKTIAKAYNVQWDGGQSDLLIDTIPQGQAPDTGFGYMPQAVPGQSSIPTQQYPQQQFPQQGFPQQGFPQPGFPQQQFPQTSPLPTQQYPGQPPSLPHQFPGGLGNSLVPGLDFPTIPTGDQKAPSTGGLAPSAPSDAEAPAGPGSDVPDFDELTKRFEALKRRK
ncbi:hypothetical protein HDV00_007163 [Rhizophlyctis rosea]|nr:hypothetical protein HDV00_007163 [Rhizophlyctis rosea]